LKNRKNLGITLILFITMNAFFGVFLVHFINSPVLTVKVEDKGKIPHNPILADAPPIANWAIIQNATSVYRLFESINFTLNTLEYSDIDYTRIQISFTNGSNIDYDMTLVDMNEYYYEYRPEYNAPLGFQNVSFLLYNNTDALLNAHTTYTNFTIKTNYMVTTNSSEYYIGDDLYAELSVNNFGSYEFGWNITIVNSTIELLQNKIFNLEDDLVQFTFRITNETFHNYVGQTFYIKLNMTNKTLGQKAVAYFPFKVLNSDPTIDESSITFSPSEIFRTEECEISFNVTDIEDPSQGLDVSMILEDPEGDFVATITLDYNTLNNFSTLFSIPAGSPTGKYRITINAEDQDGGISSFLTFITAKNNFPEIHSYLVNGKSIDEAFSILYGNDLIFSFNVSDVEEVAYIKVALIDENNEWYNVSKSYTGINTQITIRTIELITGVWYVYIYVVDSDGVTTSLVDDYDLAPQSIRIIPDVLSSFLPWTAFILGTILGILVGVGLVFRHYKSKFADTQTITQKKKPSKKKPSKKKQQREEIPKKISEKESEEIKPEEEEVEKELSPKRKIKRKL